MLTYQQLVLQLQSGESQLKAFQMFRDELKAAEAHLQLLEPDSGYSQFQETIKPLIKWLDWFITDTG